MRLGVFQYGWWGGACRAAGHDVVPLPVPGPCGGNAYAADLAARMAHGPRVVEGLRGTPAGLLLDNGGTGLTFMPDLSGASPQLRLTHEYSAVPLCSHFIDPITTAFQGLDFLSLWQALQSQSWVKAVWDKAHAIELRALGVPQIMHLPMAAPDRQYDTNPLDAARCRPEVSFVGGQNSSFFRGDAAVRTPSLLPGVMAHCHADSEPQSTFFQAYHDAYGFAVHDIRGDIGAQSAFAQKYFHDKLFYHAMLCMRNRDRFVISLKRRLGDKFRVIGNGWKEAYGLPAEPQLPTTDAYFRHFRETAINLNLVNGNAETGLNMRHFEITAAGGFMLCHAHPELGESFEIGKECAIFTSEADLMQKIEYYFARPDERTRIAQAGQKRSLSQHLYSHRLQTLLRTVFPSPIPVTYSTTNWKSDLKEAVPEPDIILDCGANTGQMAAAFSQLYPKATIYSFEPVSAVFETLTRNCAALRVEPVKVAVADRTGRTTINLTTGAEAHSLLSYEPDNPCAKWTWITGKEEIDLVALDDWIRQMHIDEARVHVMKLDIQGAELLALYGARRLLRTVKAIFLEVSFVRLYKDAPLFGEIDRFLSESGFHRRAVYPSDQPSHWGDALYIRK